MKVIFITTNKHKFQEVQGILKEYPVELEQLDMEYEENHDEGLEIIAKKENRKD